MFNISSCASQNSTTIISSTMDFPSSSTSTFMAGGRALDRHNPIITDEKRSGSNSKPGTPIGTPCTHNTLLQKPKTPIPTTAKPPTQNSPLTRKKKPNKSSPLHRMTHKKSVPIKPSFLDNYNDEENRKSFSSKPSDLIMKAAACTTSKAGVDYFSPPESSRYLLDDTSFLDVLSDFDPVLKLAPYNSINDDDNNDYIANNKHGEVTNKDDQAAKPSKPASTDNPASSDQVVVLRVSLHCRGCERKMRKHLSKMTGVTSFNIDFAAKKVTVIGDVTPLGVLASISKVKTAKLWAPATISSSCQINSRSVEVKI